MNKETLERANKLSAEISTCDSRLASLKIAIKETEERGVGGRTEIDTRKFKVWIENAKLIALFTQISDETMDKREKCEKELREL